MKQATDKSLNPEDAGGMKQRESELCLPPASFWFLAWLVLQARK
jgi:hypothetical protein